MRFRNGAAETDRRKRGDVRAEKEGGIGSHKREWRERKERLTAM